MSFGKRQPFCLSLIVLMQKRYNCDALAMELFLFFLEPSMCFDSTLQYVFVLNFYSFIIHPWLFNDIMAFLVLYAL